MAPGVVTGLDVGGCTSQDGGRPPEGVGLGHEGESGDMVYVPRAYVPRVTDNAPRVGSHKKGSEGCNVSGRDGVFVTGGSDAPDRCTVSLPKLGRVGNRAPPWK